MQVNSETDESQATWRPARPAIDSVERAVSQVGDGWTFLVLREAFFGVRRFDEFQRNLKAAPNILTSRLKKLVSCGLLDRIQYLERPPRYEYRLTAKGRDLYPATVLLMQWGDKWLDGGNGAPLELVHAPCGHTTSPILKCDHCNEPIVLNEVQWKPGPGAAAIDLQTDSD
jgi:DNA-binding HxlR family transcriptional regulator